MAFHFIWSFLHSGILHLGNPLIPQFNMLSEQSCFQLRNDYLALTHQYAQFQDEKIFSTLGYSIHHPIARNGWLLIGESS